MLYLYDRNFEEVCLIETYKSLIWTTRYYEAGDFELYIPASREAVRLYRQAVDESWYIVDDSNTRTAMIVTKIKLEDEADNGQYLSITGYCLKHLLNRRVVWGKTYLAGSVENELRRLVNDNAIQPEDGKRVIPGLYLGETNNINDVINYEIAAGPLDQTIASICKTYRIGWNIELDLAGDPKHRFKFVIFKGMDRTAEVTFTTSLDNLLSTEYEFNIDKFRNNCFVESYVTSVNEETNEVERNPFYLSIDRKTKEIPIISGLDRYETCITASQDGSMSTLASYQYSLVTSARKELINNKYEEKVEGTVVPDIDYILGVDYFLGDLCYAENGFGMMFKTRVTEVITTKDNSQFSTLPTFAVEEEDEDSYPKAIEESDCRSDETDTEYRLTEEGALRFVEKVFIEERLTEDGIQRIIEGASETGRDTIVDETTHELISKWEGR